MLLALALVACTKDDPVADTGPLGIPLVHDGRWYAGAAKVDITPEIRETFTDTNGDHTFEGCNDDPTCGEPFDDVDGDGWFDATWIGGYGPMRPAVGVHDHTWARAVVLSIDGEYVAIVALDLVGLGHPRIWQARDALAADGFDPIRLIVSSSHDHDGPDTMGLWGNPILHIPGFDPQYQQRVAEAIETAVRDAAEGMEPVDLKVGAVKMSDRGPWFNGPYFGGKNPDPRMHGMIHDGRDPIVVSDQVLALQGTGERGTVFTLTNWSGHPEVRSESNNLISSDWVGTTRDVLEQEYGGIALHVPESLGGMQSALHGDLQLVLDDGTHVWQTCSADNVADPADTECYGKPVGSDRVDADGDVVPQWAEQDSWDFVRSHGWHIAEAAIDALDAGTPVDAALHVDRESFLLPITNVAYNLWGPMGIFDMGIEDAITDPAVCPEYGPDSLGCVEAHVFRLEMGETLGLMTVPGEMLPELSWGLPDDPEWDLEASGPEHRGADATYFPQQDPDCLGTVTDYEQCRDTLAIGDCDCLSLHAWPYRLSESPHDPLLSHLHTQYRAMVGMADSYFSYVIPEPDFNHEVSLFTDDGDHYEDTVSAASVFADRVLEAHEQLDARF